jgi:hypothetical protein
MSKSEDFKFPSLEERKEAYSNYPNIRRFGFPEHSIANLFNNTTSSFDVAAYEVQRDAYLFYWDLCLLNKLGKMHESYVNLIVNYNRGVPDNNSAFDEEFESNKFLFDFYTETFYYFYISARDYIGQIISVFCRLRKKENEVDFNKLINQISNENIKAIIKEFSEALQKMKR